MGKKEIFIFIEYKGNKVYQNIYSSIAMAKGIVKATVDNNKENIKWACVWDVNKVYYELICNDYCQILEKVLKLCFVLDQVITKAGKYSTRWLKQCSKNYRIQV